MCCRFFSRIAIATGIANAFARIAWGKVYDTLGFQVGFVSQNTFLADNDRPKQTWQKSKLADTCQGHGLSILIVLLTSEALFKHYVGANLFCHVMYSVDDMCHCNIYFVQGCHNDNRRHRVSPELLLHRSGSPAWKLNGGQSLLHNLDCAHVFRLSRWNDQQ